MPYPRFALLATAALSLSLVFSACTKDGPGREHATHSQPASGPPLQGKSEVEASSSATARSEGDTVGEKSERRDGASLAYETVTLGGDANESLPWIIALHGLGDTPHNFLHLLRGSDLRAHVYALRAIHPYGDGFDWYDARLTGDQGKLSRAIEVAVDEVSAWVRAHARDSRNQGKPVLFGFSQGGMLSFALATRHPDLFRAAVPVSGLLPNALWPDRLPSVNIPILALHGTEDPVIPIGPTRALVAHLKSLGFEASLTEFDGVAHRIPSQVHARLIEALTQHLQ